MTRLAGIDVSKWQTASDWTPAGLTFVIARASIGTSKDTQYDAHIAKAKAAGLMTGAYHFNWDDETQPSGDPRVQARFFVQAAGDVDFLFLDVEGNMSFETDEIVAFIDEVHKLGKRCGLYMSSSVYKWTVGQDYDWIAKWSTTEPSGDWEFWQYSSDGEATDGGRLDLDYFDSTLSALRALSNRVEENLDFTVFKTPQVAVIADNAYIYDNPACDPSNGNLMIDPGPREMPVAGKLADGTLIVGYVDSTPTETVLKRYFAKPGTAIKPAKLDDGITQATVDAAVAAQKATDQKVIDGLNATIASLKAQVADLTSKLAAAVAARDAALAAQKTAEAVAAKATATATTLKEFLGLA